MKAALFAWPAGHSLSPQMHNAAFAAIGMDARYEARGVPPEELKAALMELRSGGWLGVNLSIPHKIEAMPLLDEISPAAQRIGAVNTIVVRDGELHGHNTDAGGFYQALLEIGLPTAGDRALVLGAGGASRAICYALLTRGIHVHVANRTMATAAKLAEEFADIGTITAGEIPGESFEIVVNTTAVGMSGGPAPDESPMPAELFAGLPQTVLVSDVVYNPAETMFLTQAREFGFTQRQNGISMLLHQGVLAFELFTQKTAPVSVMREAIERAIGR